MLQYRCPYNPPTCWTIPNPLPRSAEPTHTISKVPPPSSWITRVSHCTWQIHLAYISTWSRFGILYLSFNFFWLIIITVKLPILFFVNSECFYEISTSWLIPWSSIKFLYVIYKLLRRFSTTLFWVFNTLQQSIVGTSLALFFTSKYIIQINPVPNLLAGKSCMI